ncbi:ABC transporter permease [candidate division KSB1 bacterium]
MLFHKNSKKPPRLGEWILKKMHDYSHFGSLGDLEEEYYTIAHSKSEFKAQSWYWKQVLTALPEYLIALIIWRLQMVKHYVKVSLRNIIKNKSYSFINIFGLSLSLSIGFIIMQILATFYSFDRFHQNKDNIYRVTTRISTSEGITDYASVPLPIASELINNSPAIEKVTRIKKLSGLKIEKENIKFNTGVMFVDPEFFDIFSFDLKYGNPQTVFLNPYSIVLTHNQAEILFGEGDPTGKNLRIKDLGEFIVTGVFDEYADLKSHIDLKPVLSSSLLPFFESQNIIKPCLNNWDNFRQQFVYFLVHEDNSIVGIQSLINEASEKHFRQPERKVSLQIQKLMDILPGNSLNDHAGNSMPYEPIYTVIGFALIIALIAGFNYTNLSIARAVTRTKEVGVRKVLGAKKRQIFSQYIGEAVVLSTISFFSAYLIYRTILRPGILNYHVVLNLYFAFKESFKMVASFFVFAVMTGIIAGYLPAKYVSRLSVSGTLRFSSSLKIFSGITLRKVLIISQFTFSLVFLISTIINYRQSEYINKLDIGFETENIINVNLRGNDYQVIKQKFEQEPRIQSISACDHLPGTGSPGQVYLINPISNDSLRVFSYSVDHHFIENLNMELAAGRNFPTYPGADYGRFVILNEFAAKRFGFEYPADALGEMLLMENDVAVEVIGILKDFAKASAHDVIPPCVVQNISENFRYINLRFKEGNIFENAKYVEALWKEFNKEEPFNYTIYTEMMDAEHAGMNMILGVVGFISVSAILISLLGLIGIVDYSMKVKLKEIGVRKVLGANTFNIIRILSSEFFFLLLFAVVLAIIPAFYLNNLLLTIYAIHNPMKAEYFVIGSFLMLIIGLLSILTQAFPASQANPADILKDD